MRVCLEAENEHGQVLRLWSCLCLEAENEHMQVLRLWPCVFRGREAAAVGGECAARGDVEEADALRGRCGAHQPHAAGAAPPGGGDGEGGGCPRQSGVGGRHADLEGTRQGMGRVLTGS